MTNFLKIAEQMDVLPLLLAIQRQPQLWNQNTLRTTHPGTPHTEVDDIWLRFNDLALYQKTGDPAHILDQHESINYPALAALPQARPLIFWLMARAEGERLGRCLITRVKPGCRIAPHEDGGEHAAYYERFHIVLQSNDHSRFACGDEEVIMQAGEIWWFDNSKMHAVYNDGAVDRIHLIVDIRCPK